ncbi:ABC transporter transmembrane domain-containing protein [Mycoplasmopsis meleagridis]
MFILGAFFILLNVFLNLFFPNLISQFITLIFNDDHTKEITIVIFKGKLSFGPLAYNDAFNYLVISVICLIFINIIFTFCAMLVIIYASEQSSKFFRIKLFAKVQKLSLRNIADLKSESIITRLSNDIATF